MHPTPDLCFFSVDAGEKNMSRLMLRICICYFIGSSLPAHAGLIKLNFTGQATSTSGVFASEIVLSNVVSGAVFFDTDFPTIFQNNALGDNQLTYTGTKATSPLNVIFGMEIKYGTLSYTTVSNAPNAPIEFVFREVLNNPRNSNFQYFSKRVASGDDSAIIRMFGGEDIITEIPNSLTFDLVNGLDLSAVLNSPFFGSGAVADGSYSAFDDASDVFLGDIVWNITSLNAELIPTSTVPIPAAVWLFGSGLIGLIGMRRQTSKSSKLST